jgi:hypothetical protein
MKKFKLSNVDKYTLVDDDIYELIKGEKWYLNKAGYPARDLHHERKRLLLHRYILNLNKGDGKVVDHVSGNKLDNTRNNLRICSHLDNLRNQRVRKDSVSGYKGVKPFKQKRINVDGSVTIYNSWQIVIVRGGKQVFSTSRKTLREAIDLYNKKIVEINGKFCRLNILKK